MTAPTLFDVPTEPFRNSDPPSSKDAARSTDTASQRQIVFDALVAIGGRGTCDDVWHYIDTRDPLARWQRSVVSSRLSQLKDPKRYDGDPPVVVIDEMFRPREGARPVLRFAVVA